MFPATASPPAPASEWGHALHAVAGRLPSPQRLLLGTVQGSSANEYPVVIPDAAVYWVDLGAPDPDIMATRVGTQRRPPPRVVSANGVCYFVREPSADQRAGSGKSGDTVSEGTAGGPALGGYGGRRGWVQCAGGAHDVFCALLAVAEVGHFKRAFRGGDARTLPVITGATGRLRDWHSVAAVSREEKLAEFPAMDPRSPEGCAQYQMRDGGPILLYNLSDPEIAYRLLQLLGHCYGERAAEHAQGRVTTDGAVTFMGINPSASKVWPSLLDSASKELEHESGVKKHARRPRKDQVAHAKAKNKKKITGDHDGE